MLMIIFNQYTNSLKNKEGSSAKVVYNTYEEIDLLINVLKNSSNIWKEIL